MNRTKRTCCERCELSIAVASCRVTTWTSSDVRISSWVLWMEFSSGGGARDASDANRLHDGQAVEPLVMFVLSPHSQHTRGSRTGSFPRRKRWATSEPMRSCCQAHPLLTNHFAPAV